jgi:hypothetical protein
VIDGILRGWLSDVAAAALALATTSDILELQQVALNRFVATYASRTLACEPDGQPYEVLGFRVGFYFDPGYLREVDPQYLISVLEPNRIFHPNGLGPFLCIGPVVPGTSLVQLLYRVYDVLTYNNFTPSERDALNPLACSWARRHQFRFPLESRPLKRRSNTGGAIEMGVL